MHYIVLNVMKKRCLKFLQHVSQGYLPSATQTQAALFYQPGKRKSQEAATAREKEEPIIHCTMQ